MSKFIWVRDLDKIEHYINVDHIIRLTKIPAHGTYSAATFIILNEGINTTKNIRLSQDEFDTYEEVIAKIQAAA